MASRSRRDSVGKQSEREQVISDGREARGEIERTREQGLGRTSVLRDDCWRTRGEEQDEKRVLVFSSKVKKEMEGRRRWTDLTRRREGRSR